MPDLVRHPRLIATVRQTPQPPGQKFFAELFYKKATAFSPLAPVAAAHNFDIVQSTAAACHATGSKLGLLEYINAIIVITTTKTRITAVANEKSQNVQDVFLNHVRKSKTPVTVFLVNGVKLQGVITWFDNFSVLQSKAETPAPVEATGTLKLHRAPEPQYDPDMEG
jgi:host factor-I protein